MDAPETINRMIDLFPPHERIQVRAMLAGTLRGIVGQRLMQTANGADRVAVCEVMVATGRVRDFVVDPDQTGRVQTAISEDEYYGIRDADLRPGPS